MSNWKALIPLVIVVVIAAFAALYFFRIQKVLITNQETALKPTPAPSGFANFPKATAQTLGAQTQAAPQTQPQTGQDPEDIGIVLENPAPSDLISSPVQVSGKANVFEGLVQINIKDQNGKILGQGKATACMDIKACPFKTTVSFEKPTTATGTIEVYSSSPKNGSPEYLQTATIKFY